jgi:anhydro-N-acetylmuramic acid kinase
VPATELYLGIMSGTSADGVDAVLVDLSRKPRQRSTRYQSFSPELRSRILRLQSASENELHDSALTANELARSYADCANALLQEVKVRPAGVRAIGCHGQTVRHRPELGFTLQLVNGALLAELTGITVVCDFRNRDVAAGGEGAPLVPAFHAAVFQHARIHRVIVNIGGIANITDLPVKKPVRGFDTGPGNVLLDAWSEKHLGTPHDEEGRWAKSGRVLPQLLELLLNEPFFRRSPPKSTGRDAFHLQWLQTKLNGAERPADVEATLVQLTATTISAAIRQHCAGVEEIYVCGGGVHNAAVMECLRRGMKGIPIETTEKLGIAPDWVEASAFAWLAQKALLASPGNLPAVTGASGPRVLGAIYPGTPRAKNKNGAIGPVSLQSFASTRRKKNRSRRSSRRSGS